MTTNKKHSDHVAGSPKENKNISSRREALKRMVKAAIAVGAVSTVGGVFHSCKNKSSDNAGNIYSSIAYSSQVYSSACPPSNDIANNYSSHGYSSHVYSSSYYGRHSDIKSYSSAGRTFYYYYYYYITRYSRYSDSYGYSYYVTYWY